VVIGLTAFLTLVDLFATQALLPALAQRYAVSPAAMGVAVNACTLGMAVSSLAVAVISNRIERRSGIWISLALLAIPTVLLSVAPDLATFAALRVAQGIFMAAAFALMLAYLGEHLGPQDAAGAFAAYVTGNVASNLFGRLFASAVADHLGLSASFYVFALLNLAGAALVYMTVRAAPRPRATSAMPTRQISGLLNGPLLAGFGTGFCILFAFIGTFTYVNFVLAAAPFQLGMMSLGFVYLVFLPSIATTPLGGRAVAWLGTRLTMWSALGIAAAGLPLLLSPMLAAVLTGLALVGIGTFLAQAAATGFIGKAAPTNRALASGLYLASYFLGGLVGSAVLGQLYVRWGWTACVIGIGAALAVAAALTTRLHAAAASNS
jgi:YNFM family putative membrane transporter